MLSKEKVKHIAKLARLGLTPGKMEKFRKELSSVLDYIEKLKEIDISKVKSNSHFIPIKNIMREDAIESQKLKVKSQKLIGLAPETEKGYLKVKSILK